MKILAGLALLIAVTGCTQAAPNSTPEETGSGFNVTNTRLPDGRIVLCVSEYKVGLSCDWDHAK